MQIQLNHQQVLDLRAYIDVADVLQQLFVAEKMPVQLQGGIDDEHATIVLLVDASPEAAVALLKARGLRYMTYDYHRDEARTVASYQVEFLRHQVVVVATELHAAPVLNIVQVSNGDGMGGLNLAGADRRYMAATTTVREQFDRESA